MTNPEKICECGHQKQRHIGGRGHCQAIVAGYHCPQCHCGNFRASTPQFERSKRMESSILAAIDFLESLPGPGIKRTCADDLDKDAALLVVQMKSALLWKVDQGGH